MTVRRSRRRGPALWILTLVLLGGLPEADAQARVGAHTEAKSAGVRGFVSAQDSPLVIVRDWSPGAAVVMALPAPASGDFLDDFVARVSDRALLAAIRERTIGRGVEVTLTRDGAARYFAATSLSEDAEGMFRDVDGVFRDLLPSRHVMAAAGAVRRDLEFRAGSPKMRFEAIFQALLHGRDPPEEASLPAAWADVNATAARILAKAPAAMWGPPARVVVLGARASSSSVGGDGEAAQRKEDPQGPGVRAPGRLVGDPGRRARTAGHMAPGGASPVGSGPPPTLPGAPPWLGRSPVPRGGVVGQTGVLGGLFGSPVFQEPVRTEIVREVVSAWVGLAYQLPPRTTLFQAHFLRLVLEGYLELHKDPFLYELASEIDAGGRLVFRFSVATEEIAAWESRLEEGISALRIPEESPSVGQLFRRARSLWSQRLSTPAGTGATAAQVLLRGGSGADATAVVRSLAELPAFSEVEAIAREIRLAVRVVYGAPPTPDARP